MSDLLRLFAHFINVRCLRAACHFHLQQHNLVFMMSASCFSFRPPHLIHSHGPQSRSMFAGKNQCMPWPCTCQLHVVYTIVSFVTWIDVFVACDMRSVLVLSCSSHATYKPNTPLPAPNQIYTHIYLFIYYIVKHNGKMLYRMFCSCFRWIGFVPLIEATKQIRLCKRPLCGFLEGISILAPLEKAKN